LLVGGSGSPATSATLEIQGTTGALLLPRLNDTQRDALTKTGGLLIYNSDSKGLQVCDGTNWINWKGTSVILVAASDAPDSVKSAADYVCDGVADEVEITAAINALANKGGRVQLSQGTFTYSSTGEVQLNANSGHSNIHIAGVGDATVIDVTNQATDPDWYSAFEFYLSGSADLTDCKISDLSIIAASTTHSDGAIAMNAAAGSTGKFKRITLERLKITCTGVVRHGITMYRPTVNIEDLRIIDCDIEADGDGAYGILVAHVNGLWIERNKINLTSNHCYNAISVYGDVENFHVNNNLVLRSGHSSIAISTGNWGEVIGNTVQAAATDEDGQEEAGIEVEWKSSHQGSTPAHHVVVANNIVRADYSPTGSGAKQHGIIFRQWDEGSPPYRVNIANNIVEGAADYGIYLTDGYDVIVTGNQVCGCDTGIFIHDVNRAVVCNNICNENDDNGIQMYLTNLAAEEISICNNTCYHNGVTANYAAGIEVRTEGPSATIQNLTINNNTCCDSGTTIQDYGMQIIEQSGGTINYFICMGNICRGNHRENFRDTTDAGRTKIIEHNIT